MVCMTHAMSQSSSVLSSANSAATIRSWRYPCLWSMLVLYIFHWTSTYKLYSLGFFIEAEVLNILKVQYCCPNSIVMLEIQSYLPRHVFCIFRYSLLVFIKPNV
jgi:hypothetical protein